MATNTYVALDKKTVTVGGVASVEFTSVPQDYTDLVIIGSVKIGSNGNYIGFQFNGDTTGSYGRTRLQGDGSSATSEREAGSVRINMYNQSNSVFGSTVIHIMN